MSKKILIFAQMAFCALSSGTMPTLTQAQESLFIATVERVTLEPRGGRYCPDLCAASGPINSAGGTQICISNDSGCDHTEYMVSKVLLGNVQLGVNKFNTRLGEWGVPHFPVSNQPILVHMKPGAIEWVPIIVKEGRQRARLKEFQHGILDIGVDLRTIAPDGEDGVPVDKLVEWLTTQKR